VLRYKHKLTEELGLPFWQSYLIWIAFAVFFSIIAASAGYFNKHAEGSGIPELKSILAGVYIYKYLSFRTLVGKVIGIFGALSAGFSIGKEGPFVHLAACISNQLAKSKYFEDIGSDNILK
jgi:H+/Cl- antiporter ClcA